MTNRRRVLRVSTVALFVLLMEFLSQTVSAHCDTLDGPVVGAARRALAEREVNWVLPWVRKEDEAAVRESFNQALDFRDKEPEVHRLAETHFLETLVRLHREAEGAPYTGLKPASTDLGPAIPAADRALESEDIERVVALLTGAVEEGIRAHYAQVMAKRQAYTPNDIQAGREYVDEYVRYIHYVEHLYETAHQPVSGHYSEPVEAE